MGRYWCAAYCRSHPDGTVDEQPRVKEAREEVGESERSRSCGGSVVYPPHPPSAPPSIDLSVCQQQRRRRQRCPKTIAQKSRPFPPSPPTRLRRHDKKRIDETRHSCCCHGPSLCPFRASLSITSHYSSTDCIRKEEEEERKRPLFSPALSRLLLLSLPYWIASYRFVSQKGRLSEITPTHISFVFPLPLPSLSSSFHRPFLNSPFTSYVASFRSSSSLNPMQCNAMQ